MKIKFQNVIYNVDGVRSSSSELTQYYLYSKWICN